MFWVEDFFYYASQSYPLDNCNVCLGMNEISHSISADISQSILSHIQENQCVCVYIDLLAKIHFFKNNYYKVNAYIQYI